MELREPSRMADFHITYILSSNIDLIYTSAKNCRAICKSYAIGGLLASRRHRGYRIWTISKIWGAQSQPLPCISLCLHSWFLWPAHFFFHLSDSEERLHSFSILHLKSSHHVHFMILMGITGETLLMPVPSAISLVSLTLSVAPGVWPSPPYAAPHDGPWCLTSLLLLWGVATGQREPSTNHCGIWRKKTGGLCTSVQV